MDIHLDAVSRRRSSDLPIRSADHAGLLDLAPGGVYLAAHVSVNTGGLLHHPFTIAHSDIARRSCLLSVALSIPANGGVLLFRGALSCGVRTFLPANGGATISPTSIIYSSDPSQNNIILQLEQEMISALFLISITVCGGSWL